MSFGVRQEVGFFLRPFSFSFDFYFQLLLVLVKLKEQGVLIDFFS